MSRNPGCTVFIVIPRIASSVVYALLVVIFDVVDAMLVLCSAGNLDEKVPEKVLYEILIQVGRVVDLHIPRDKETNRSKGYAFAEYETEEIAQYAVKLFSGLVRLRNRTLRFAISGQDKPSSNGNNPVTPRLNPVPQPKPPQLMRPSDTPVSHHTVNGRIAGYGISPNHSYDTHSQAPSSGLPSRGLSNGTYEYSRRVFGSVMDDVSRRSSREPIPYPSY
ncbi:hypothetical protein EJB05_35623 [Eragrostis curvula]|uniref:RRM domain-containing protein n=1 Tax=Eragrostis curvula TaxID=38414 RepID=A0A5J9U7A4_9POAL|nr:hypothetical protein EJB05_35623 [Eragrostis curvula]